MRGYKQGQKFKCKTNPDYIIEICFTRFENGKTFYFVKSDMSNKYYPYCRKEIDEQFELIE